MYHISPIGCGSIFLFLEGNGYLQSTDYIQNFNKGSVIFVAADTSLELKSTNNQNVLFYRAHVNLG